jgi:uncharacterized protein
VDVPRKRIGLSMRKDGGDATGRKDGGDAPAPRGTSTRDQRPAKNFTPQRKQEQPATGGFGAALLEAMKKK